MLDRLKPLLLIVITELDGVVPEAIQIGHAASPSNRRQMMSAQLQMTEGITRALSA